MTQRDTVKSQCTAVYKQIQAALDGVAKDQTSSELVGDIIYWIRTSAIHACADFAERWNSATRSGARECPLPRDILALCFHEMGFEDRVRASHVSRKWRAAALADCTLWTTFSRAAPSEEADCTEAIVDQLTVMLRRSGDSPISVKLPASQSLPGGLEDRLVELLCPEIRRIRDFDGSYDLYSRLTTSSTPTRRLFTLKLQTFDESARSQTVFRLSPNWGTDGAPSLRQLELVGPTLSIPSPCAPLLFLTRLKFHIAHSRDYMPLFQYCPNLVSLALTCFGVASPLPHGPPPSTLKDLSLAAKIYTDFARPLAAWNGHTFATLALENSMTLAHPLKLFTSSYAGPIRLSITVPVVRIEAADEDGMVQPPWLYIAHIPNWRNEHQLGALRDGPCAARLVRLQIHMDLLGELFELYLSTPVLAQIEIALSLTPPDRQPVVPPKQWYGLRAPRLRALVLNAAVTEVHPANASVLLIRVFRDNLRCLLGYEALLLDSITVKGSSAVLADLGCIELAPLATMYVQMPHLVD